MIIFFTDRGGIFNYISQQLPYEADFALYYKFMRGLIGEVYKSRFTKNKDKRVDIYFYYINNTCINAIAAKVDGDYSIGINSGVVYLLERMFYTIMANPNNLPEIGDVSIESGQGAIEHSLYEDVVNFYQNGKATEYSRPKDEKRAIVARFLTMCGLGFLAMHELSHILNGHLDYLGNVLGIRLIQERQVSESELGEYLLSQALEFDADAIGVSNIFNYALAEYEMPGRLPTEMEFIRKDRYTIIGLTVFAIESVFKIFGSDSDSNSVLLEQDYPTINIRRKGMSKTIATLSVMKVELGRYDSETSSKIFEAVAEYELKADLAFEEPEDVTAFTEEQKTASFLERMRSSDLSEAETTQVNIIKAHWNKIRSGLEVYAYSELSPIDETPLVYINPLDYLDLLG